MKNCPKCHELKPFESFGKNKAKKDGLQDHCSPCRKLFYAEYKAKDPEKMYLKGKAWRTANREYKAAADKKWAENNREKSREIKQRWKDNNPEKVKEMSKNYCLSHVEERSQKNKQWRLDNPEKHRLKEHRRRARIRQNGVFLVSDKEIKNLLSKPCFYCGEKSMHIDHIVPLSRGGNHSIGNIVQACAHCNLSKNAKFITEWKKVSQ